MSPESTRWILALLVAFGVAQPAPAQPACTLAQVTDTAAPSASTEPSLEGGAIAFLSSADLTGGNPDGSIEIFLWDGSGFTQITDLPLAAPGAPRLLGGSVFLSLDDGAMAFTSIADHTGANPDGSQEIFLWDGSSITQVTDFVGGPFEFAIEPSLDGGSIAFSSNVDLTGGNPDGSIEIFLWDGSSISQITDATFGGSSSPSLDGGSITFASNSDLTGGNPGGFQDVFLWDGSSITQISDSPSPAFATLPSLDGGSIAFTSNVNLAGGNPDGLLEIFLFDGTSIVQVTDAAFRTSSSPDLSDGAIAFKSNADFSGGNPDGNFEIFFWDGSGFAQVTDTSGGGVFPSNPGLDGGAIAFASDHDPTGGNPDGNPEIFLAVCAGAPSVLEIPAAGPGGLAALALLLAVAAVVHLRRRRLLGLRGGG